MNCPEHWTHIISTDVRVKSHCKEFPVNKGTCTRLSMSGSSIFAVLVTHLAFWSGLSAADFPLFSGQMCPPLSSKTKTCGSVLAHYLFVKMHLCQSLAMHIPLCVFMISSATHTLCPPPQNYYPAIYIESLLTSTGWQTLKGKCCNLLIQLQPRTVENINECSSLLYIGHYSSYLWHSLQREKVFDSIQHCPVLGTLKGDISKQSNGIC